MTQIAIEVAHWSAILPLALLAVFRRGAPAACWLTAAAFACSFIADSVAALSGGSWSASPWYLVAQFGLFGLALVHDGARHVLPAIALYAGLGTLLYLRMRQYATEEQIEQFMPWWHGYQVTRLAAFGLFVRAVWRA